MGCFGSKNGKKKKAPGKTENVISSGDVNDFYELGEVIGEGGYSVVYRAKRKKDGAVYAVKKITKIEEGLFVDLLLREIYIMKKLNHPNVLKLYDVFEDEDYFWLVLEFVDGSELFDKIVDRVNYSEKDSANIVKQLVKAMKYLHQNNIVHRNLKPETILSQGEGDDEIVKVDDFGFENFESEEELLGSSCRFPGYVAPEVLTEDVYTNASDMFSVGVITYILLSGYPPFYDESPRKIYEKIANVKFDFDDPAWKNVSDSAKDLITKLLVKNPKERLTAQQCEKHPWLTGADNID